jgi:hypothetical protein
MPDASDVSVLQVAEEYARLQLEWNELGNGLRNGEFH